MTEIDYPSYSETDRLMDSMVYVIAKAIKDYPEKNFLTECSLDHVFTNGLYSREITMPKDIIVISEKHLTEHQFFVLQGVVSVWTEEEGWVILQEGHKGITKPGTQRILITAMETKWVTVHANPKGFTTADEIYDDIIDKRINPFLEGRFKNNVFIPMKNEPELFHPKLLIQ